MILSGDIGGTKTRLSIFDFNGSRLMPLEEEVFLSKEWASLSDVLKQFLATHRRDVACACFGVAGPVFRGRCHATNLPWTVDASQLVEQTGIPRVFLLNDLEATAYSLNELESDQLVVLQAGLPDATGNQAVIAAGTGLGEAGLFWNGRTHVPFASEGGHTDFSPRNELEIDLLQSLLQEFGHVSWERVVSGPGLVNIYRFLCQRGPTNASEAVAAEMSHRDAAKIISQAALEQQCPVCERALDLFVSLYGAEAGNLALKLMASAGLYIAGGIAPKLIKKLQEPTFLDSFASKGRFRTLLEMIPVRVVMTTRAALLGAARYALIQQQMQKVTCIA